MTPFDTFLLNNYYHPVTLEEYVTKFHEWLADKPEEQMDFSMCMGDAILEDVMEAGGVSAEKCMDSMDFHVIMDLLGPSISETFTHMKYYDYLVEATSRLVINSTQDATL